MTNKLHDVNILNVVRHMWLGHGFFAYKKVLVNGVDAGKQIIKLFIPTVPCKQLPNPKNNLNRLDTYMLNKRCVYKPDRDFAKFRCNGALVVEGSGVSAYNMSVVYERGKWVYPDYYDDGEIVCTNGIHFFLTEESSHLWMQTYYHYTGVYKYYNDNGILQEIGNMCNGIRVGLWKEIDTRNNTFTMTDYANGSPHEYSFVQYRPNNSVRKRGQQNWLGCRIGKYTRYSKNGDIKYITTYGNINNALRRDYYRNNEIVRSTVYTDDTE